MYFVVEKGRGAIAMYRSYDKAEEHKNSRRNCTICVATQRENGGTWESLKWQVALYEQEKRRRDVLCGGRKWIRKM